MSMLTTWGSAVAEHLAEHLVELRGGPTVTIRPIRGDDGPRLASYLEGLSSESRYMRFMQATPRISSRLVESFTGGDPAGRLVLVAVLGTEIVGEAMLVVDRADDEVAEVAYSVADRLHRRGLGRALVELLLAAGRRRDVRRIRADLLGENRASVALLLAMGARLWFESGALVAELVLDGTGAPQAETATSGVANQ